MKIQNLLKKVKKVFTPEQAEVLEEVISFLNELVKASDFNELKGIVAELATAQKELAEAQKRSEERLTRLEMAVEELASAQRKTEERLNQLAIRVDQLAEAQRRTEEELRKLIGEHKKTREELGGLFHTVGYVLEDRAMAGLPKLLKEEYGIETIQPFVRKQFTVKGDRKIEVNILGKGRIDGRELWIIGEAKSQLKKKDVNEFIKKWFIFDKLFPGEKFYLLVTYSTSEEIENYAKEKNIKIYYSYQFPL